MYFSPNRDWGGGGAQVFFLSIFFFQKSYPFFFKNRKFIHFVIIHFFTILRFLSILSYPFFLKVQKFIHLHLSIYQMDKKNQITVSHAKTVKNFDSRKLQVIHFSVNLKNLSISRLSIFHEIPKSYPSVVIHLKMDKIHFIHFFSDG